MSHAPTDLAAPRASAQPVYDRVLALAGLLQALAQVRRVADTGEANERVLATAMESLFRFDAPDTAAVYGGLEALRPGLQLLKAHLAGQLDDPALVKLAMPVLQLERRFDRDAAMIAKVRAGLEAQVHAAQQLGASHPDVLAALGALYADTLSHLRPKVLVQGNPHYLGQPGVVAEVRALLLAAVRSAVLWRQRGGSLWDMALQRRAMAAAVDAHLR